MAASFPGAIKTFSAIVNGVTKLVAALFNSPYDEVTAIETELGTDPAGSLTDVKTRLAVSLNDNGTIKTNAIPTILGAWASKTNDTTYQAATDGIIVAYAPYSDSQSFIGYSDSSNPPTTVRAKCETYTSAGVVYSITFPVKKNDYYKVVGGSSGVVIWWIPMAT